MKLHNLAFTTLLAAVGVSSAALGQYQPSSPPPPPPMDNGAYGPQGNPGNYQDQGGYQNQGGYQDNSGYNDQQPYYDPRPDGNYDSGSSDDQYNPQAYSDNQGPVDESVFYGELSPYGRWIQRGSYGWVWEPTQVAVGWRPYSQGHWVDTDYGWTWVSSEPWGWATYHYGRWTLDSEYGWLWVPGSEWGPAWVSFQEGNGYVGWAPLPPSVGFQAGIGIQIGGLNLSAVIDPYAYSFVAERSFLDDRLEIEPPARNVTFIHNTRNITSISVSNNRVFNRGLAEDRIAQATGRPVRHYQIAESRNPAQGRVPQVQGDRVQIFRPGVTLARPRADVTPAVAVQRRQQRMQQAQRVQPGQPAVQPGRQVQPGQQAPGRQAQDHAYDQANQPNPGNGRRVYSPADMPRKHQAEQQQLQARQDAERSRLMQAQQQEQSARQGRQDQAATLQAQHQAEQQAQQQQHQREQQMLQARHQREQQAAQSRPQQPPPERQNQQQQQQRQQQQRQENRKEQRDQPPPPPPPV